MGKQRGSKKKNKTLGGLIGKKPNQKNLICQGGDPKSFCGVWAPHLGRSKPNPPTEIILNCKINGVFKKKPFPFGGPGPKKKKK